MSTYDGKIKLAFCERLGKKWRDLADYFEIEISERDGFEQGNEAREVWEWLDRRERLNELPEALRYIGRDDLVVKVLEPPPLPLVPSPQAVWPDSPYPGLRYFSAKEADIFFGRSEEIRDLLKRLTDPLQRFIAVVGASGSGKSSLVMAGVIPRLPSGWISVRFTPGEWSDDPFLALAAELKSKLESCGLTGRAIADQLRARGDVDALARLILEQQPPTSELLLFVDQFEELFTLVAAEHQQRFVALLTKATQSPRVRVILTVRADFYPQCIHVGLEHLLRAGSYPLAAPKWRALLEMITGPAALAGLQFENDLPGQLLEDTGQEPGVLALLAFTLAELYRHREEMLLTRAAYDGFGRVQGAISQRAEAIFTALDTDTQAAFEEVFRELVQVDERGVATRQRASLRTITVSSAASTLIDHFVDARLLVREPGEDGLPVVEVAHEALFRNWPRLQQWIQDTADDHRLRRHITQLAAYWHEHDRKPEHRWSDERIVEVIAMREHLKLEEKDFSERERDFLGPLDREQMVTTLLDDPATTHEQRAIIGVRLALLGDSRDGVGLRADGVPDIVWCEVPPGTVTLEADAGTFTIKETFSIAKYPVTYRQYRAFLEAKDGYHNPQWWQGLWVEQPPEKPGRQFNRRDNHPAENIAWLEAVPFCRWLSVKLGYEVRLPTEWEWQQAATGGNSKNKYPWGPNWDGNRANTYESELSRSVAVGMYPQGESPVGALDMSGNLWEWCLNAYDPPGNVALAGDAYRVVRGGSWNGNPLNARAAYRANFAPDDRNSLIGFRLVCASPIGDTGH